MSTNLYKATILFIIVFRFINSLLIFLESHLIIDILYFFYPQVICNSGFLDNWIQFFCILQFFGIYLSIKICL